MGIVADCVVLWTHCTLNSTSSQNFLGVTHERNLRRNVEMSQLSGQRGKKSYFSAKYSVPHVAGYVFQLKFWCYSGSLRWKKIFEVNHINIENILPCVFVCLLVHLLSNGPGALSRISKRMHKNGKIPLHSVYRKVSRTADLFLMAFDSLHFHFK